MPVLNSFHAIFHSHDYYKLTKNHQRNIPNFPFFHLLQQNLKLALCFSSSPKSTLYHNPISLTQQAKTKNKKTPLLQLSFPLSKMDLSVVPYQQQQHHKSETVHDQDVDIVLHTRPITTMISNPKATKDPCKNVVKYKECMRNHAASIGGHANDGCGEFMPRGDDGTRDWLTCAACGCHRNFHRRESSTKRQHQQQLLLSPPPQQFLLYGAPTTKNMNPVHDFMSRPHDDDDDDDGLDDLDNDRRSETPERGEVNVVGSGGKGFMVKSTSGSSNKRFRTKFTQEQKERMLEFAEKIGWRIQKHDDMALNQFCNEIGIKRNVLKVWMHNNKNAHRRRDGVPPVSAEAPPPLPPSAPPQPVGV